MERLSRHPRPLLGMRLRPTSFFLGGGAGDNPGVQAANNPNRRDGERQGKKKRKKDELKQLRSHPRLH